MGKRQLHFGAPRGILTSIEWRRAIGCMSLCDDKAAHKLQEWQGIGWVPSSKHYLADDVKIVLHMSDGEIGNLPWLMLGILRDGRYFGCRMFASIKGFKIDVESCAAVADHLGFIVDEWLSAGDRAYLGVRSMIDQLW